jgi:transcriptional regulator with XRE-family HTH domain
MLGGEIMKAIEVIQNALKSRGMKQKDIAAAMGLSPQGFSKKLVNDTISAAELFKALDLIGLEVFYRDKATGSEVKEIKTGVIPRVSMVVNQIRYDTNKADALCHTEALDGWMTELYRDFRGRYFIVHWTEWDGVKPSISPCEESHAMRFYEDHREADDDPPNIVFGKENG